MVYETTEICAGKVGNGKYSHLRMPVRILPDDQEVRAIANEFNKRWPEFLAAKHIGHEYKGNTGKHMIELLGNLLAEKL